MRAEEGLKKSFKVEDTCSRGKGVRVGTCYERHCPVLQSMDVPTLSRLHFSMCRASSPGMLRMFERRSMVPDLAHRDRQ